MAIEITPQNFDKEITQSSQPVILYVYALWCGPCQLTSPVIEELEKEMGSKYKFAKLNFDKARDHATKFEITSLPAFIFITKNEVKGKEEGYIDKEDLQEIIEESFEGESSDKGQGLDELTLVHTLIADLKECEEEMSALLKRLCASHKNLRHSIGELSDNIGMKKSSKEMADFLKSKPEGYLESLVKESSVFTQGGSIPAVLDFVEMENAGVRFDKKIS